MKPLAFDMSKFRNDLQSIPTVYKPAENQTRRVYSENGVLLGRITEVGSNKEYWSNDLVHYLKT